MPDLLTDAEIDEIRAAPELIHLHDAHRLLATLSHERSLRIEAERERDRMRDLAGDLLRAVDAGAKRGDYYHERNALRAAIKETRS